MRCNPLGGRLLALVLMAANVACANAQSFSVATTITPEDGQYVYAFTLVYDRSGEAPALTAPIWQWTFYLEPYSQPPAVLGVPDGWSYIYKPETGEFCWFTQGPDGWVMGDYGSKVLLSGQSLAGFRVKTPMPASENLANAFDTQSSQDVAMASLPTSVYGDLDADGVFNMDDAVTAVRIAAGLQPTDQLTSGRGDVLMDGQVTLADALYLIRRLGVM